MQKILLSIWNENCLFSLSKRTDASGMNETSGPSMSRGQLHQCLLMWSVCVNALLCVCSNPIRGQIWVCLPGSLDTGEVYNAASRLCLHHSCLFIPWKPTGVASMTKQIGFSLACCVSGSRHQAAGSSPVLQNRIKNLKRWIWCSLPLWLFINQPFKDASWPVFLFNSMHASSVLLC